MAFAEVGADVLCAPGLPGMDAIRAVVKAVSPKPVNVVVGPRSGPVPLDVLAGAGVKRVSLGGALYRHCMAALVCAGEAMKRGDLAAASAKVPGREIEALLPG